MCVLEDVCMKLWHVQGALKLQLASETERADELTEKFEAAEKTINMQSAAIAEVMHVLCVSMPSCVCMCLGVKNVSEFRHMLHSPAIK